MSENDKANKKQADDVSSMLNVSGILTGVSSILEKFGELADKAESFRSVHGETQSGKKIAGSYGFSVKFGAGKDSGLNVTPLQKDAKQATYAPVPEGLKSRECHVDMFDEGDHLLVVAEMPGVSSEDVNLTFVEKTLHIKGASRSGEFSAIVDLPREFGPDAIAVTSNNGIVEIRLTPQP